jgi:multiple sugar transport system permease protein
VITVAITIGSLLIASLAAYVITKHRVPGRRLIFLLIVASMMVPWQTTLIPNYVIMRNLGWLDSYAAYIIPALAKAFVLFFLVQFLQSIPNELIQAARVDGAGEWRIWWKIVLPLLRPALATATILICLYVWNDVFYAFFVVGGRLDTLPLNLFRVASAGLYLNNWHLIFAYVVMMSLPMVAVFVVAQRRVVAGITSGAVK